MNMAVSPHQPAHPGRLTYDRGGHILSHHSCEKWRIGVVIFQTCSSQITRFCSCSPFLKSFHTYGSPMLESQPTCFQSPKEAWRYMCHFTSDLTALLEGIPVLIALWGRPLLKGSTTSPRQPKSSRTRVE